MGKYETITRDVLKIFATPAWKAHGIPAHPRDYVCPDNLKKFVRVNVVLGGQGLNRASVSGQIIIDIFIPAGNGPIEACSIADKLDVALIGVSHKLTGGSLQVSSSSSLVARGRDEANPSLSRYIYAVSCSFFGV